MILLICAMWNRATIVTLVLAAVFSLASCSTQTGAKVKSIPDFLANATSRECFNWRALRGPDYEVFYGTQSKSKSAGIGIYLGEFPNFHPDESAKSVNDKLGNFPIVWFETVKESSPKFYRATVIEHKTTGTNGGGNRPQVTEKIHIWVYGDTQGELERMTDCARGLKLFTR